MRFIPLEIANSSMILAQEIFDTSGRILVGANTVLTQSMIDRLIEYGFSGIYIQDKLTENIKLEYAISDNLRNTAMNCIKEQNIDGCVELSKQIITEMLNLETISLDLMDLRSYDDYTYAHSVNVAVLCCTIGMGMNLPMGDLECLVTAALLHDLGKLQIPPEILNKPSRLTPEEYELMKTHSKRSYELIKDRIDLSAKVKNTVLYHHENYDGSGYPYGINYMNQSLLVRILHVADVYDALISKRPYKKPYSPLDASEYLMGACGILFDHMVVKSLLAYIPLFPKGTNIQLSDGREGIVYKNTGYHNLRPIVILMDGTYLDLTASNNLNIGISSSNESSNYFTQAENSRKEMTKAPKKPQILAVDDLKTNLEVIRSILELNHDLILSKSGEQALKMLQSGLKPDLILMDIDMPEMNGLECTAKINELSGNTIPILFVSALASPDIVSTCRRLGAAGYILRPYNPTYMKSEIARILYGHRYDE